MSHDQKPGKIRLVGNGAEKRRRGDMAPAPGAVQQAAAGDAPTPKKGSIVLPLLFLLGCALGGAAFPLLRVL